MDTDPTSRLADAIRRAIIDAAEAAYEDAGIRGLCAEGRWEAAVQGMRGVDVEAVARGAAASSASAETRDPPASSTSAEFAASAGESARFYDPHPPESPG